MKELIEKVVQWGVDRGLDKVGHLAQAKYTLKETAELLDAYADSDVDKINDAIGDILVTLIVGASNDESILRGVTFSIFREIDIDVENKWCSNFDIEYRSLLEKVFDLIRRTNVCKVSDRHYFCCIDRVNDLLGQINCEFNQSLSLKDCLQLAYDEIKDRTGKMVNGQFIKDS